MNSRLLTQLAVACALLLGPMVTLLAQTPTMVARAATEEPQRPQRVLFLGDSMSMGEFGKVLDREMREAGCEVYTYVAGGATPYYWLSRFKPISSDIGFWMRTPSTNSRKKAIKAVPKVEPLIEKHNPDIVVIQTGTNLYASLRSKRRTKAESVREVAGLCADMASTVSQGGRQVYWITPPKAHQERYPVELQEEMGALMQSAVSPYGVVFDSRAVTTFVDPYPKTDGIHYGPTEAAEWAMKVAEDFVELLGPQRRAEPPTEFVSSAAPKAEPVVRRAVPVDPGAIKWGELDLTLRLREKTALPKTSDITYQNACILYEYDVLKVNRGYYPYDTIYVAHLGIYKRKPTGKAKYSIGTKRSWRMMPIETYSFMERLQLFDDLAPDPDKPIYVIKQD